MRQQEQQSQSSSQEGHTMMILDAINKMLSSTAWSAEDYGARSVLSYGDTQIPFALADGTESIIVKGQVFEISNGPSVALAQYLEQFEDEALPAAA